MIKVGQQVEYGRSHSVLGTPGAQTFPCQDRPNLRDKEALGHPDLRETSTQIRAVYMGGGKRLPRKGEWYLSGAEIGAYRAESDLPTQYYIARLIVVEISQIACITAIGEHKL